MKYFDDMANAEIITYLRATKTKIDVKAGLCRYNYKCHMNAVNDAVNNKEDKLAMCMYINGDYPIIHFINVDSEGKFTDNTLGVWCSEYEYFFIKYITKEDFFTIDDVFTQYRKYLRTKLSFIVRLLSRIEF